MGTTDPIDRYITSLLGTLSRPGYNLRNHPFVSGVAAGKLSLDQLRGWTLQMWVVVNDLVHMILARTDGARGIDDLNIVHALTEMRIEEEAGAVSNTATHAELFLRFGESLGLTRRQIAAGARRPATHEFLKHMRSMIETEAPVVRWTAFGLAVERPIPLAFVRMVAGLRKHYRLNERALEFFRIHEEADEEHGALAESIARQYIRGAAVQKRTRRITLETAKKLWALWDCYRDFGPAA